MEGLYFNHSTSPESSGNNSLLFIDEDSAFNYENYTDLTNATNLTQDTYSVDYMAKVKERILLTTYILYPLVLSFGVFGNIVTLMIFTFNTISSMASRYILIFLTCCDTIMLLTQTFNKMAIMDLIGTDVRALSLAGCKIFYLMYRSTKMMSSWLVVLLCFERFLAVVFPLKVKVLVTKRRVFLLLAVIFALVMVFNGIWTFSVTIIQSKKHLECRQNVRQNIDPTTYNAFLMLYNVFFSWFPLCFLSIFTPIIIFTLCKKGKERNTTLQANHRGTETVVVSCMLVGVVIAYIIFIFPVTVFFINNSFVSLGVRKNTPEFLITKEVIQYLEMMNYSTNFLLYTFCSATYRLKAKQLFCGRRRRLQHARACLSVSATLSSEQVSISSISLQSQSSASVA